LQLLPEVKAFNQSQRELAIFYNPLVYNKKVNEIMKGFYRLLMQISNLSSTDVNRPSFLK
jgi:hypothetical protein